MKQALAIALLMLAAPAVAEPGAQEKLAWSMRALLGGDERPIAAGDCDEAVPLCAHIGQLEALRKAEPSLICGDLRVLASDRAPQLLALARRLPEGNRAPFIDTIILFNTSAKPVSATVMIDRRIDVTKSLLGRCSMPNRGGLLKVSLQPYETMVCAGAVAVN